MNVRTEINKILNSRDFLNNSLRSKRYVETQLLNEWRYVITIYDTPNLLNYIRTHWGELYHICPPKQENRLKQIKIYIDNYAK